MSRYKTNSWSLSQQNIRIYLKHFFSLFLKKKTIVNDYVLKWEWHVKINKYEVGLSRGVAIRAVNIILTNFSLGKKQMWQCDNVGLVSTETHRPTLSRLALQGSPFLLNVKRKLRRHSGTFHCCSFCSSGGAKEARCGCPGTMPGTRRRSLKKSAQKDSFHSVFPNERKK